MVHREDVEFFGSRDVYFRLAKRLGQVGAKQMLRPSKEKNAAAMQPHR